MTVQIQISWLLQKPTDLDLHCLLRQGMACSAREGLKPIWAYFAPLSGARVLFVCLLFHDFCKCSVVIFLTHLSLVSHRRDISKQCNPRSDASE